MPDLLIKNGQVIDGINGLLVPPGDIDALARAVAAAASERETLSEWGAEGRRLVEEEFSWNRRVKDVLSLYESLIEQSGVERGRID